LKKVSGLHQQAARAAEGSAQAVRLYVGVLSASQNREKRDAVRATWGSHPALARVVFVLARPQNTSLLQSIRAEALEHDDIILAGHVWEHYNNITHQTLELFRSAYAYHGSITHVCKCDDDSYIHVERMLKHLDGHPFERSWAGRMEGSYVPRRDPSDKWYVTREEWPDNVPAFKYSNGPGYVLTFDLVRLLILGGVLQCSPGPQLFKWEDVAVGSWLACLEREQNITLNVAAGQVNLGGCSEGDLVSHYIAPATMQCMHTNRGNCC
jgi:hypothetical protein